MKFPSYFPAMLLCLGLVACSLIIAGCTTAVPGNSSIPVDPSYQDWRLTLNGTNQKVLTLEELQALPATTGHGYAVSTTGMRFGPYTCKGVDLRDLVALVGGLGPDDRIWVSAPDGYMWVFDHEQLEGNGFITFDENLREIPSPSLRVILMYEQNGTPLSYNDGGPARICIISREKGVVTEGSAWVKWVDRIEIKKA